VEAFIIELHGVILHAISTSSAIKKGTGWLLMLFGNKVACPL
jgi:hypothetical protein